MARLRRLIKRRSFSDPVVVLESPRTVLEAITVGIAPSLVALPVSAQRLPGVLEVLDRLEGGAEVLTLTDLAFESLAPTVSPQPMLAVVDRPTVDVPEVLAPSDLVIVLIGVADPGNTGTIIRVAAACAARCVVVLGGADPWAPKAVRASVGTVLRVPVAAADDAAEVLRSLRSAGAVVIAADARGGTSHDSGVLAVGPLAVVVGSEARGLDRVSLGPVVDHWVRIRMAPTTESLNVAMATTLLAYEARRGVDLAAMTLPVRQGCL